MTTTTDSTTPPPLAEPDARPAGGRWLVDWRPEDGDFWQATGRRVAARNLVVSIFTEHVGFSVWSLWSVFALFLTPDYGISADPKSAAAQKFLLTALPTALGAGVRLPYTIAVARFGGRNWTIVSALLLLVPTLAAAVVLRPGVSYGTLLVLAALAGVGGGNFASSMANINSFYPQRRKGWALGLNAGGGNVGVAAVQLVGLVALATTGKDHPRVLLAVYVPLIVIAALCASFLMDNIAHVSNERHAMRDACRYRDTWIISVLYIGTFGSFIGFGFAFGQVLQNQFASHFMSSAGVVDPVKIAYLTFLGPLVGSLMRPVGGKLADRFGGAVTTFWNFLAMAIGATVILVASSRDSLALFYVGFIVLFVFSGIGNGSTYKLIPAVFRGRSDHEHEATRIANAVIGIAGAIGAFGGVLVNVAFRQSFLSTNSGNAAYAGFIAFYLLCLALTWTVYLRGPRGTSVTAT